MAKSMVKLFRLASIAMIAAMAALVSAEAGQTGHILYNGYGGQNSYLAPDERLYHGDYMVAEYRPSYAEPMEVLYYNGSLSVWWYCNDLSCNGDPTGGGGYGWHMLWSSGTYTTNGFFYNGSDGNACIWDNNTSQAIWCSNTTGSSNFYAYQGGLTPSHMGCALQSRISDGATTFIQPGTNC